MDSRSIALAFLALCASAAFITWSVLEFRVKMAQMRKPLAESDENQRLARIEAAVETIAIEVERISEAQRFSARLAAGRVADSLQIERPITPH